MSVIPLVVGQTVATTEQAFEAAGGRQGSRLLIRSFDTAQLAGDAANLSYDLRVGAEYKDHRDGWIGRMTATEDIPLRPGDAETEHITLHPGDAVIIETEESVHMPAAMFGYIVPRVRWLQQGISNTLSKIDPGYNGRLLITLFNLGRNKVDIPRLERFCSLVIHDVADGARLYEGEPKRISGTGRRTAWQRVRDGLEANRTAVEIALILVTAALIIADVRLHGAISRLRLGR
jgi:dCTP deaminase